jgi:hypothetical protein
MTPLELVIGRLGDADCGPTEKALGRWEARCPAHDDRNPSLDITEGDDGRVLLICRAGCSYAAVMRALDLDERDGFAADTRDDRPKPAAARGKAKAGPAAPEDREPKHKAYQSADTAAAAAAFYARGKVSPQGPRIYLDADGTSELFRIYRVDLPGGKKQFRPVYRDDAGWRLGNPFEKDRPLYHLDELAAAEMVFVLEGEKCADLAREQGVTATTSSHGSESARKSTWSPLAGKVVVLVPDHDQAGERYVAEVGRILSGLNPAPFIRVLRLPLEGDGDDIEQWLDSLPAAMGPAERKAKLLELAEAAEDWKPPPTKEEERKAARAKASAPDGGSPYSVIAGRICREVTSQDGTFQVPLCDFDARIVEEIWRDDGVERSLRFRIEGTLAAGGPLPAIEVSSEEFVKGEWPLIHWGRRAVVLAGAGIKDHLRAAIQLLSDGATSRTVYAHTGWRQVDGEWCYLHGGGAIGTAAVVAVDLLDAMQHFVLPDPPAGESLRDAVRAALRLLEGLAPDRVMMPIFGLAVRAILPGCAFSGHLAGKTGRQKTELAALMQRFYGAGMHAKELPANWSSTANSLEGLAFACKDALLVVDDFNPHGTQADVARYHKEADRLLRAQGNRSGRQRCRPDGTVRPAKPPRGTILSTGEDIPRGESLRARQAIVEVEPDDVDLTRLSACQADAAAGLYAATTAAYAAWMAPQFDAIVGRFKERSIELRGELAGCASHRRVPDMIGELLAAFEIFTDFGVAARALSAEESGSLRHRCRTALVDAAARQESHQAASDPVERFRSLLGSVLSSGAGHIAATDGRAPAQPDEPSAWGWRRGDKGDWYEQGRCIGWLESTDLLLDPESVFAAVNRLATDQGEAFSISPSTLYKRLDERGMLVSKDAERRTVRWTVQGVRRRVLHLRAPYVAESGPSGPSGPDEAQTPEKQELTNVVSGTALPDDAQKRSPGAVHEFINGPLSGTALPGVAAERSRENPRNPRENEGSGPLGPLGPLLGAKGDVGAQPFEEGDV